jgi:hypothetical protein
MILPKGNAWGKLRGKLSTTPQQALDEWGFVQLPDAAGIIFREYRYLDVNNRKKTGTFISNYFTPTNPQTTRQNAMRHHFGVVSKIALTHTTDLMSPIWRPLAEKSGKPLDACNLFRSINLRLTRKNYDYTKLRIADGNLAPCPEIYNYSYELDKLRVNFSAYCGVNGSSTDIAHIYIFVKSTEKLYEVTGDGTYTRADGTFLSADDYFISLTNLIVFVFFTDT